MEELSDLTEIKPQLLEDISLSLSSPKDIVSTHSNPKEITEEYQEYSSD